MTEIMRSQSENSGVRESYLPDIIISLRELFILVNIFTRAPQSAGLPFIFTQQIILSGDSCHDRLPSDYPLRIIDVRHCAIITIHSTFPGKADTIHREKYGTGR